MLVTAESWKTVTGIMMTTGRIDAYGGISFPRSVLEDAAESIRSEGLSMHVNHDLSKPVRTRNFDAFVEAREDGIDLLRFTVEVHPDDAHWIETNRAVSVTISEEIKLPARHQDSTIASIKIGADHAWYSDESIIAAETTLLSASDKIAQVRLERVFQFSFTPDPQIFLELTGDLFVGIGVNAIWQLLISLFRRRQTPPNGNPETETTVNLIVKNGDSITTAIVSTNNELVALRALAELGTIVQSLVLDNPEPHAQQQSAESAPSLLIWDEDAREWKSAK